MPGFGPTVDTTTRKRDRHDDHDRFTTNPLTPGKPTDSTDGPRRGPIGRIIAGSLATGLLGAVSVSPRASWSAGPSPAGSSSSGSMCPSAPPPSSSHSRSFRRTGPRLPAPPSSTCPEPLTVIGGLTALMFGLASTEAHGRLSARTLTASSLSAVLLAAFATIERRARRPLVAPHTWKVVTLVAG